MAQKSSNRFLRHAVIFEYLRYLNNFILRFSNISLIKISLYLNGSKRVPASTSGNERTRMSAAFSASASGIKLPIHFLINRATELTDFEQPDNSTVFLKFSLFCKIVFKIFNS